MLEGEEGDNVSNNSTSYANECGIVLQLWNYPTGQSIVTGIPVNQEEGFFCYLEGYDKKKPDVSFCSFVKNYAAVEWMKLRDSERDEYKGAKAKACKLRMDIKYLTESCVQSEFRVMAQESTVSSIEDMISKKYNSSKSLCMQVTLPSMAKRHVHVLTAFNEDTLKAEADIWRNKDSYAHKAIAPLVMDLIAKAEYSLKFGPHSVMKKTGRLSQGQKEKLFYHSALSHYWPLDLVSRNKLADLKKNGEEDLKILV